jgi:hypothetical protein
MEKSGERHLPEWVLSRGLEIRPPRAILVPSERMPTTAPSDSGVLIKEDLESFQLGSGVCNTYNETKFVSPRRNEMTLGEWFALKIKAKDCYLK